MISNKFDSTMKIDKYTGAKSVIYDCHYYSIKSISFVI